MLLAICIFKLSAPEREEKSQSSIGQLVLGQVERSMLTLWSPALSFARNAEHTGIWQAITGQFPILHMYSGEKTIHLQTESGDTYEDIIRAEGQDEYSDSLSEEEMQTPKSSDGRVLVDGELAELLQEENSRRQNGTSGSADGAAQESGENGQGSADIGADGKEKSGGGSSDVKTEDDGKWNVENVLPRAQENGKVQEYQWDFYKKYDALVKEFYAVDASTVIDSSQLNLDALLGKDLSIEKRQDDQPQILIYHTHSQEDFANSVKGDMNTTIMGVGEVLAQLLEEEYGYNVMHHLGQYDVENRDYAYNNSLPALEQLLEENPTIEVVIDLHRDEVAADRKLVTEIEGRQTAMFMFFNGLSRTRKHGDIEYLPNENIADNLAFSFQMQALCNEYYPGLTRRIYLKGYRYNMHLKARYLLIEMGAQTNDYEECYNACIPLARILDMELSGVDFGYGG